MKGSSGAAEKIKYSLIEMMNSFQRYCKVSTRLVYATRSYKFSVTHMNLHILGFTKTDKTADGAGGSAVGAQKGSPFRMKK